MKTNFYGAYHWEFKPVSNRLLLLGSLAVFADDQTNLFIESLGPSVTDRIRYWKRRSTYRSELFPDALSPPSVKFHIPLTTSNLELLANITKKRGLGDHIAHLKGYRYGEGLFWFHGFGDECDETLCCSKYVTDDEIEALGKTLGVEPKKIFGALKTERETKEYFDKLFRAMESYDPNAPEDPNNQQS